MMRRAIVLTASALAVLALGAAARAAVTVNGTVTAGTTLSVANLGAAPSFSLTLNGNDQTATYALGLEVVDARGLATGGGWNLTIVSTQFSDGAGDTFPAAASTITGVAAVCASTSTCTLPTNSVSNTSLALPTSGSPVKFVNATSPTGRGRIDLTSTVQVAVPANTIAGTYSSTVTVAIAAGP